MKKKPRRQLKKNIRKKLQKQAGDLWKLYVRKRDKACQMKVYFPKFCFKEDILQPHHIFGRGNKNIFLDVENGMLLCSGCHTAVTFQDSYKELARKIAIRKNKDIYERLHEQSLIKGAFLNWKYIFYLQRQISILEEMIKR